MKKILFIFIAMFVAMLTACTLDSGYEVTEGNTLTVGLEAAYAPYNWTTTATNDFTVSLSGQAGAYVDGYDVVVARAIADELGLILEIVAIEWDGLIPALTSNQIDVIIAGMSPTAERAQTVSFSDEYYRATQVIVVRSDSTYTNATSIDAFANATVIAQLGTLQNDLIDQITDVNHATPLDSYNAITQAVRSGEADAFIAELPVAMGITQANSDLMYITFSEGNGFTVTDADVTSAVAVRQSDTDLITAINQVLANISVTTRELWMTQALDRQPGE